MWRFCGVVLFSCSNVTLPTSEPAASLVPVSMPVSSPTSVPAFDVCAPPVPALLAEVSGWGVFQIGASPDEYKNLFEKNKISFQWEESRAYGPSRVGEPVSHATMINISFTCGAATGRASLTSALSRVRSLSITQKFQEQEARERMSDFVSRYGEPARHNEVNYENIYRDDRCWTNATLTFCAILLSVKGLHRTEWSLQQHFIGTQP